MITGTIGCSNCHTILYEIEAVETAGPNPDVHTGVFMHVLRPLDGAVKQPEKGGHLVCANCGGTLTRVAAKPDEVKP